jgi:methylase of polypeptide subunit release factors
LAFYRAIGAAAARALASDGQLWFEAHHRLARASADALRSMGFGQVHVLPDLSGNDRFIRAERAAQRRA